MLKFSWDPSSSQCLFQNNAAANEYDVEADHSCSDTSNDTVAPRLYCFDLPQKHVQFGSFFCAPGCLHKRPGIAFFRPSGPPRNGSVTRFAFHFNPAGLGPIFGSHPGKNEPTFRPRLPSLPLKNTRGRHFPGAKTSPDSGHENAMARP